MADNNYLFCPLCATKLVEKHIYDAQRQTCPMCGFINFLEPKLVAVVIVEYRDTFLLGRRNMDPGNGLSGFWGGAVNRSGKVEEGAIPEAKEEAKPCGEVNLFALVYS